MSNDAYLKDVKKVGEAPLEKAPDAAPAASSGFELLKPGEPVPDAAVRRSGRRRRALFDSFKGSRGRGDVHLHAAARCRTSAR